MTAQRCRDSKLGYELSGIWVSAAALKLRLAVIAKANFDPNQPRAPRGVSEGGQWIPSGGPDDGNRYEVVYGQLLVTPAPRAWHQFIVQRLSLALGNYLASELIGVVLCPPADISSPKY